MLGFPCDQFGHQEPGDEKQIAAFCSATYDVTFPMFAKIEVNGEHTHPLYALLKKEAPGLLGTQAIKWNFTKFLVDRSGAVRERFAPTIRPSSSLRKSRHCWAASEGRRLAAVIASAANHRSLLTMLREIEKYAGFVSKNSVCLDHD